jgi:hypothetical protein
MLTITPRMQAASVELTAHFRADRHGVAITIGQRRYQIAPAVCVVLAARVLPILRRLLPEVPHA